MTPEQEEIGSVALDRCNSYSEREEVRKIGEEITDKYRFKQGHSLLYQDWKQGRHSKRACKNILQQGAS